MAEQIGGQIFIDTWGLVIPGDPELAAEYAKKAASVSSDGEGIYGGMFIAACISAAFVESDIEKIINTGLSVIPSNCEYASMVRGILGFHRENPDDWRACYQYAVNNFGYEWFPRICHIIPNSAFIVLSLLYSGGEFSRAINICNMCGMDTDCNVGNVGTIMGVRCGIEGIDTDKWIKPVNDFFICSSLIGSLNIMEIPWCTSYIANLAYKIAGEPVPAELKEIIEGTSSRYHFELPGSTHGFRVCSDNIPSLIYDMRQTNETACKGKGSLKVLVHSIPAGGEVRVFLKTYYRPEDFEDSRYDPSFSPVLYPGQSIQGSVLIKGGEAGSFNLCLYVKDGNSGKHIESEKIRPVKDGWNNINFKIPALSGACIEETGIKLINRGSQDIKMIEIYLDEFNFSGNAEYTLDFSRERLEVWNPRHIEVSQFTYLKGIWTLEDGCLSGSCSDFGEAYTGAYDWKDYIIEASLIPVIGGYHNINFRVKGAVYSYAVGLAEGDLLVLYKNENGYKRLAEVSFPWKAGNEYRLEIKAFGQHITVSGLGRVLIEYSDNDRPYLTGQIGASVSNGSHCHYKFFKVKCI